MSEAKEQYRDRLKSQAYRHIDAGDAAEAVAAQVLRDIQALVTHTTLWAGTDEEAEEPVIFEEDLIQFADERGIVLEDQP
jgi:flagellar biosynthesis regulator FlaF